MTRLRRPFLALLALALAGPALAGAKKQSPVAVRFYAEGGAEGGDFSQKVQLLNSGRSTSMQSLPLVTEREITAFYPFAARDGSGTFGAYFKLDPHGANLFSQHTMSRKGSYVFAYFNGRHVIDLYVDRGVTDGIVSIPSGLTAGDIDLLTIAFPTIGQEKSKRAKPKAAPTPPLKAADMPRMQPAMLRQPDGTLAPARTSLGAAPAPAEIVPRPLSPVGQ